MNLSAFTALEVLGISIKIATKGNNNIANSNILSIRASSIKMLGIILLICDPNKDLNLLYPKLLDQM